MPSPRIAVYTDLHFVPKQADVVVRSRALRRPELVVRHTSYRRVIVDERVLTRGFQMPQWEKRLQGILLVRGRLLYGGSRPLDPGQVLFLHPHQQNRFRWEDAEFFEIEWRGEVALPDPVALGPRVDQAALLAAFVHAETTQRDTFDCAVDTFRRAGLPVPAPGAFDDLPSDRDHRIAHAIGAQLSTLGGADSLALGELAGLSPRQLQRVYSDFCVKYGLGLSSWRDTRNRWRVQVAAVLLSRPELSVAQIAEEVGYRSVPAVGRAFAKVGFPPPAELRRRLIG